MRALGDIIRNGSFGSRHEIVFNYLSILHEIHVLLECLFHDVRLHRISSEMHTTSRSHYTPTFWNDSNARFISS